MSNDIKACSSAMVNRAKGPSQHRPSGELFTQNLTDSSLHTSLSVESLSFKGRLWIGKMFKSHGVCLGGPLGKKSGERLFDGGQ